MTDEPRLQPYSDEEREELQKTPLGQKALRIAAQLNDNHERWREIATQKQSEIDDLKEKVNGFRISSMVRDVTRLALCGILTEHFDGCGSCMHGLSAVKINGWEPVFTAEKTTWRRSERR